MLLFLLYIIYYYFSVIKYTFTKYLIWYYYYVKFYLWYICFGRIRLINLVYLINNNNINRQIFEKFLSGRGSEALFRLMKCFPIHMDGVGFGIKNHLSNWRISIMHPTLSNIFHLNVFLISILFCVSYFVLYFFSLIVYLLCTNII